METSKRKVEGSCALCSTADREGRTGIENRDGRREQGRRWLKEQIIKILFFIRYVEIAPKISQIEKKERFSRVKFVQIG